MVRLVAAGPELPAIFRTVLESEFAERRIYVRPGDGGFVRVLGLADRAAMSRMVLAREGVLAPLAFFPVHFEDEQWSDSARVGPIEAGRYDLCVPGEGCKSVDIGIGSVTDV